MAERHEEPDTATEPALDQASPAAVSLALGRTGKGGKALDVEATGFLRDQRRLINLQTEHLHEQRELQTSRLRWGRFSDRMKAMLQVMTAAVGLAVATAVAVLAWQAHEDRGLTITAFSVPPDLAQRGLTGQVVAARVLDRLSELQTETVSIRPASTYARDWGDDIKVEIPETGVSVGELNRFLRQWLGDETRVSGEVVRTASGLSVTARAGVDPGKSAQGAEGDIDALIAKAAEALYAATQPYRYAAYLDAHGKPDEAMATYTRLAKSGTLEDRRWAYTGWAAALIQSGDNAGAADVLREGQRLGLDLHDTGGDNSLVRAESNLGHSQAVLDVMRKGLQRDRKSKLRTIFDGPAARRVQAASIAAELGDSRSAARGVGEVGDLSLEGGGVASALLLAAATEQVADHDVSGGRRALDLHGLRAPDPGGLSHRSLEMKAATVLEDWARFIALSEREEAWALAQGPVQKDNLERGIWPALAVAYARIGRQAEAEALAAGTPLDCDPCLDARAQVAAARKDWAGADSWFATLERRGPEIPSIDLDWGQALLAKGDLDGAIAKLTLAHEKGPHFADPLELWGEALMRKGDYAGAVAKFAEADTDAPKWGGNHMRWGEALMLSGRYAEARAQYEAADGMDLSKPDRAALNVLLARTAAGPLHG